MSKARLSLMAGLLAGVALAAGAQNLKPGLWEMSTKSTGGSDEHAKAMAESQKHMDSMPPEQRKKMEEMMAKHGVSLGRPGGGMSIKVCMTQAMIDRNQVSQSQGNCKQTSVQRSGNTVKFSSVCTDPPATGEGVVTFASPEAYSSKMTIHTTRAGKPQTSVLESSGKFLSTDCGAIKPMPMPAQ